MCALRTLPFLAALPLILQPLSVQGWSTPSPDDPPTPGTVVREDLLHRCRTCLVLLSGEGRIEGRLVDVRSDTLVIETRTTRFDDNPFRASADGTVRKAIALHDVSSVRCGDRVYNGLIFGFLAGGLPAAAIASGVTSGDGADPASSGSNGRAATIGLSFLSAGAVGALVGFLIDSASGPRGEVGLETLRRAGGD